MQITLRLKLTLWYSFLLALTLVGIGVLSFITVSNELRTNLDTSLENVAAALDDIIKQKQDETKQPLKPPKKSKKKKKNEKNDDFAFLRSTPYNEVTSSRINNNKRDATLERTLNDSSLSQNSPVMSQQQEEMDAIWVAVYQHILLNSKNYFIQVADKDNQIVWKSENLRQDSLPLVFDARITLNNVGVNLPIVKKTDYILIGSGGERLRVATRLSKFAQVSVAYPEEEIQQTLRELFSAYTIAFPVAIFISMFGGWLLARFSLKPVDRIINAAHDITAHNLSRRLPMPSSNDEIGRLTSTLNEMIERLQDSFEQIRQFTSDVSHELRTPLAILMGEMELALRSPKQNVQYKETIMSALEEVTRLSKVVQSLLEISRAETGQVKIDFLPLNLSDTIRDIAEDMQILAEEKGIKLESIIEDNIIIMADYVRIHQTLINVIDNSIKYNRPNGSVLVRMQADTNYAVIRVSDTGVGIPEDSLEHIFDRFFRVDKARSRDVDGTGLGLAIVKWIVESHHGSIDVESQLGKGTMFTIKFPLAATIQQTEK
ncbi:MAG TPA: ATP-binding protein [Candidatus Kapabacteria bacterium]|jgi:two-component system OmpR family sensor kinase|nr:ATP-binding protein [Candidatus Kapabacteria bacterium]